MSYRPVDLGIPRSIIESFLGGHQIALEKQRLAQEKDLRQQQLDQEKQRIENEHQVAQGHLDLAKATLDFNRLMQGQEIAQRGLETGVYPAGTQQQQQLPTELRPASLDTGTGIGETISPNLTPQQIRTNIPGLGQFITPSREEYARQLGQLGILKEAPALEKQKEFLTIQEQMRLLTESAREDSMNKLKQIELESAERRAETAAASRRYTADTSANARIKAAEIAAKSKDKLTVKQQTDMSHLNDIEDAVRSAQESLGNYNDPNSNWNKWFTDSYLSQAVRDHPNLEGILGKLPKDLTDVDAAMNTLENTIAQKSKFSPNIQNIINRSGLTGSRNQSAQRARDNLDHFLAQIRKEKENIGISSGIISLERTRPTYDQTIVNTPEGPIKFPSIDKANAFRAKHPELNK